MNVDGLKDVKRFGELINEIEKNREEYLQGLRLEFINQKNILNNLFSKIKIEPLKNIFDQTNINQSYQTLYQDGVEKVRNECYRVIRSELYSRQMDIMYATNILNTINKDMSEKYIIQIEQCNKSLSELEKKLSIDWLKEVVISDNSEIVGFVNDAYLLSNELFRSIWMPPDQKSLKIIG